MGWFRRFTDSGFGHDRGLLELLAVTEHPLAADPRWIFPPNARGRSLLSVDSPPHVTRAAMDMIARLINWL